MAHFCTVYMLEEAKRPHIVRHIPSGKTSRGRKMLPIEKPTLHLCLPAVFDYMIILHRLATILSNRTYGQTTARLESDAYVVAFGGLKAPSLTKRRRIIEAEIQKGDD